MRTQNRTLIFVANTDWYLFNFRLNLIRAARDAGWQPILACSAGQYVTRLRSEGFEVVTLPLENSHINPWHEFQALYQLTRLFRARRPAVIHLFTLKCVLYGCLVSISSRHTKVLGAITGMGTLFTTASLKTRALRRTFLTVARIAFRCSGVHLIFQNDADRDEVISHNLVKRERTSVIRGSGVDCERFKPTARGPNTALRVMFCARLLREKGIHEYCAAVASARDRGYALESWVAGERYAGNPSSLSDTEVTAIAAQDHTLLGHREDMAAVLDDVDIVMLPTYYREGTPKSLLEAAAAGKLIITTDIPGCRGIVEQGVSGFIVPVKDSHALAVALITALEMPADERARMGRAARNTALQNFSDEVVIRKTLTLYDGCIS